MIKAIKGKKPKKRPSSSKMQHNSKATALSCEQVEDSMNTFPTLTFIIWSQ